MATNCPYISCIKIGGIPIMSPLMTPQIRANCQLYKQKAIDVEHRLDRNKLFQRCMEDLINLQPQTEQLIKEPPKTVTTLENKLALDDSEFYTNSISNTVPLNKSEKMRNLTSETIDVTEYNNVDGVKLIATQSPLLNRKSPHKLIRSNSYTLEAPSPILLAHLENEARKCTSSMEKEVDNSPLSETSAKDNCDLPQAYHIIETDISVQQVSVSTPTNHYEISAVTNPKDTTEIEPQLMEILQKVPPDCAGKIKEIFEKQRRNQLRQVQAHDDLKSKVLGDNYENVIGDKRPNSLSISSSQSLYYSVTSSADDLTPKGDNLRTENERSINTINLKNMKSCNRRLFKDADEERGWAASVIGAAVKGYLVRRLIRTEKVQVLIETIKDALLCAIQLHNAEVIDERDVELHRRLIQQVSAACYSFHDIFFTLPIEEQMNIIALDRQRRIEKAKRPRSAASTRISDSSARIRTNSTRSARI